MDYLCEFTRLRGGGHSYLELGDRRGAAEPGNGGVERGGEGGCGKCPKVGCSFGGPIGPEFLPNASNDMGPVSFSLFTAQSA